MGNKRGVSAVRFMRRRELTPQERFELSSGPSYAVDEPRSRWLPWIVVLVIVMAGLILELAVL